MSFQYWSRRSLQTMEMAPMLRIEVGGIRKALMSKPTRWLENVFCMPTSELTCLCCFLCWQGNTLLNHSIRHFGPKLVPVLNVGRSGSVAVDSGFQANIANLSDYKKTCSAQTWEIMNKYANSLKWKNQNIAFFSSTPRGGGVALMRHSLVRFAHLLGIDLKWCSSCLDKIKQS